MLFVTCQLHVTTFGPWVWTEGAVCEDHGSILKCPQSSCHRWTVCDSWWHLVSDNKRRWDWMYYWCHGDNYTTEQLPGFIFNINLNDIHMKMKDLVNPQERERKDTCLSDLCKLKVCTLKVTDGHCPHPLTCQSSTPWKARGSPSSFFTSSCLFYSIFFPLALLLSISYLLPSDKVRGWLGKQIQSDTLDLSLSLMALWRTLGNIIPSLNTNVPVQTTKTATAVVK